MAKFAAYRSRGKSAEFSFEGRDEAAGILGQYRADDTSPVATADTLENLEVAARAYLGREPSNLLYLTDSDRNVWREIINEKYHADMEAMERRLTIAIALVVFCTTCLFAAAFSSLGAWTILCFAVAAAIYLLVTRAPTANGIERGLMCEMLLIFAMITIRRYLLP